MWGAGFMRHIPSAGTILAQPAALMLITHISITEKTLKRQNEAARTGGNASGEPTTGEWLLFYIKKHFQT